MSHKLLIYMWFKPIVFENWLKLTLVAIILFLYNMSPLLMRSKVCMAPINMQSKFADFTPHMEGSNSDFAQHMEGNHAHFAPHMERRHSFRDQNNLNCNFCQISKYFVSNCLELGSLYDVCNHFREPKYF